VNPSFPIRVKKSAKVVLVYRYSSEAGVDGLRGGEGTFNMCTFWYVECLARAGDVKQARFLFEKMLGYANHLGLFSEELGPAGEHLGNFPQAFTHLSLSSAQHITWIEPCQVRISAAKHRRPRSRSQRARLRRSGCCRETLRLARL
jgi:hypothetical protein